MAASEEETNGQPQEQQRGLGSTGPGSTGQLGYLGDQVDGQPMGKPGGTHKTNTCYAKAPLQSPATVKSSSTQQPSPSVVTKAKAVTDASGTESKYSCPDPPVTKATLSELDVPRIVFNPKLRYDVNFDPDLHFRPNLDGDSGRRKTQKAAEFWNLLTAQLGAFMRDPVAFEKELSGRQWCLPLTLRAILEILSTLVPPEDRHSVEGILNVEYLMQQLRKGVADLEKLAIWLSRTLKSHCAPMRDDWVDEMSKYLSTGNATRDIAIIVQGLRTLLAVLEAMKLDVANHQIRCLRPLLIQDTVEFAQTFFLKKIASGKIDLRATQSWFRDSKLSSLEAQVQPSNLLGDSWAFFYGFTSLLLPSKIGTKIPDTFMFDEERIMKLRSDMLDAVNLDVCIRFRQRIQDGQQNSTRQKSTSSRVTFLVSGIHGPLASHNGTASSLSRSIPVNGDEKIAPESQCLPVRNLPEGHNMKKNPEPEDGESDDGSPSTSRASSFSSTTSTPPVFPLSWSMSRSSRGDETVGQSILDIIDDAPGSNRWQQSCPAIALELARTCNLNYLSTFESQLQDYISNPRSPVFLASEANVLAELTPLLSNFASRFMALTSTQLFEATTSPKSIPGQLPKRRQALADVAKHSAHIGALHWRIWSPIVYLVGQDADPSGQQAGNSVGDVKGREPRNMGQSYGSKSIVPEPTQPGFTI